MFDQRNQKVNSQYNAAGDMNFGSVQNPVDLAAELEKLKQQVAQATQQGDLSEETGTDADYQITKAIQQAKKPQPEKKTIIDHLEQAKAYLVAATTATGLVTTLVGAIQVVQKLFA
jgi:hypothetical protein